MAADPRAGRTLTRLRCAAAAVALACASAAHAQVDSAIASIPHPRVAVVLSGGSAKGLAHIGVLQVLEQLHVPVDIVTGTSMGAIIGGIYSVGYSAEDLEAIMSSTDMENLFRRPTDRRQLRPMRKAEDARYTVTFPLSGRSVGLPTAVVSRQAIAERIEKYTWPAHGVTDFTTLPRAFGALVTDLGTGDPILLHKGYLAQAIEASAAVPGAFAPVRLYDGRIVVDGGAVRNLPAVNARDLGADLVICVDVSERIEPADSLRSIVDIVNQTVAFRVQASTSRQRKLCNVVIDPDIEGLPSLDFSQAAVWVARGRVAAQEHAAELAAIADSVRKLRGALDARERGGGRARARCGRAGSRRLGQRRIRRGGGHAHLRHGPLRPGQLSHRAGQRGRRARVRPERGLSRRAGRRCPVRLALRRRVPGVRGDP
jgi:NTE family protein